MRHSLKRPLPIPGFRGLDATGIIRKAVRDFMADDMPTYAAALAYHLLFSLFPFVLLVLVVIGYFDLSIFFKWIRDQAQYFFSPQTIKLAQQIVSELQVPEGGPLSVGAAIALWLASGGTRSMMNALNAAYDVPERRPAWKRYPLSILYTVAIAAILILATALVAIGPDGMQWLASAVGLEQLFVVLWTWLRWPLAVLLLAAMVALVYFAGPNRQQCFQLVSPGSVLSVVVWIIASLLFGYYVRNFASYSAMFGSIGMMIALMLYLYLSSSVFLFGAEVNAAIEHQDQARKSGA
jgi:membrane protein